MNETTQGVSLSVLTSRIKKAIDAEFKAEPQWVVAEIIAHRFIQDKNHHYLDFIEKKEDNTTLARIGVRAWRKGSEAIRNFEHYTGQKFHDGLKVLVSVTVEYAPEFGLQLIIQDVDVQYTLGQLMLNKQNILRRLVQECSAYVKLTGGVYQTRNKALKLPPVMQRIAVITSEQAAGYEDFRKKLNPNPYGYRISVVPYFTKVQGEVNATKIRDKLIEIFHAHAQEPFDAVVIIRGGGNPIDLLIFNDFLIAQAVAKFPIPIITGIGHQTDETITDLMAHTCKNAPTGAAVFILEHNKRFDDAMNELQRRISLKAKQLLSDRSLAIANVKAILSQNATSKIARSKDTLVIVQQIVMEKSRKLLTQNKEHLSLINHGIIEQTRRMVLARKTALQVAATSVITQPRIKVGVLRGDLQNLSNNISGYSRKYFMSMRGYLNHYTDKFASAKPEKILKMGFAVVTQKGKPISNPEKISKGEELSIVLSDTRIHTIVKSKEKTNGGEFDL